MSIRVLIIDADPSDLPAVLAAVSRQTPVPVIEARPVLALPAPQASKGRRGPRSVKHAPAPAKAGRAGLHDAAILKALAFSPLTLTEIAGALCRDKRDVPKMAVRLHGVLKRLVRDGAIVRQGREYAVKVIRGSP